MSIYKTPPPWAKYQKNIEHFSFFHMGMLENIDPGSWKNAIFVAIFQFLGSLFSQLQVLGKKYGYLQNPPTLN